MKLTVKTKYGLNTLAYIAKEFKGQPITGKTISANQKISEPYVEQVMLPLVSGGLVRTIRGSKGGYVLSKETKDITLLDIIEIYEGKIDFSSSDESDKSSLLSSVCWSRDLWKIFEEKIRATASEFILDEIIVKYMNNYKEGEYTI